MNNHGNCNHKKRNWNTTTHMHTHLFIFYLDSRRYTYMMKQTRDKYKCNYRKRRGRSAWKLGNMRRRAWKLGNFLNFTFEDTSKIKYEIFHTYKNANDNKYQINLKAKPISRNRKAKNINRSLSKLLNSCSKINHNLNYLPFWGSFF